jgi:hypothetical protein
MYKETSGMSKPEAKQKHWAVQRRRWLFGVPLLFAGVLWLISVPSGGFWDWTGIDGKTAWDLGALLIVPLALAGFAFYLDRRQKAFELEQMRADRDIELLIARQREEENRLNHFYDRMSELLLDRNLRKSDEEAEVRSLARSQTLTVLERLGPNGKRSLLQFLFEAGLISTDKPIISLNGANLEEANLERIYLNGCNLRGTNMSRSNLRGAMLGNCHLQAANLNGANLQGAYLGSAWLIGVDLRGANLEEARLEKVVITAVRYNKETRWPDGYMPPMLVHSEDR